MLRYNHGIVERKWRESWAEALGSSQKLSNTCTVLIPRTGEELDLENARLLVLTDFLGSWFLGQKPQIAMLNDQKSWLESICKLGLWAQCSANVHDVYDFGLISRDYAPKDDKIRCKEVYFCGRLLPGHDLPENTMTDFLADFGADALRIYFLYLGPPDRDYTFQWDGLVSAYRFVERIWQLGLNCQAKSLQQPENSSLFELHAVVQARSLQKKPHTAIAAIMGFLQDKAFLTKKEVAGLAAILQTFTPFLSAELTQLVTTV